MTLDQVREVLEAHPEGFAQDRDGLVVLGDIHRNVLVVTGTIGGLLCEVGRPGALVAVDLDAVAEHAAAVMSALSAATATPPGLPRRVPDH